MKKKNSRKWMILLGILAITSVACSCGALDTILNRLPGEIGNMDPDQIATAIVEQVPQEATEAVGEMLETAIPAQEGTAEEPAFGDIASGVENLESYQITMVMTVDGTTSDGTQVTETMRLTQEAVKATNSNHFRLEQIDETDQTSEVVEFFAVSGDYYFMDPNNEFGGDMPCLAFSGGEIDQEFENMQFLMPEDIFNDVEGGELVERGVIVNGVQTDHYKVDNVSMPDAMFSTERGDIWIAQDGGYVVRFYGDGEGETSSMTSGELVDGTIHWEYELTNINQISEIEIPEVCLEATQGGINEIPVPGNAEELGKFGTVLSFNSPDDPNVVSDFYKQEMPGVGYSLTDESAFGGMFMLTFTRDGETVNIVITEGDAGGSTVVITTETF